MDEALPRESAVSASWTTASQALADCDPDEEERIHSGLPPSQPTIILPPPAERLSLGGTCMDSDGDTKVTN